MLIGQILYETARRWPDRMPLSKGRTHCPTAWARAAHRSAPCRWWAAHLRRRYRPAGWSFGQDRPRLDLRPMLKITGIVKVASWTAVIVPMPAIGP